ncbi:MAG TPA: GNAT family N-acetyltransferase [Longimicrobium sp.]|nr:GNAT family N-acetyltransferase [Longimicrobium sp.]
MHLIIPAEPYLASYADALRRGWSPNTMRPEASDEQLEQIAQDAPGFLAGLVDRDAKGAPILLPDGSLSQRLPSFYRWMWDGEFCGSISFRWQPGTPELPPHVLGHIGYSVVPWKRGRGYATRALALFLPVVKAEGLPYVELTTDLGNVPSQKVITTNGGVLVEQFTKTAHYGGEEGLRFRIDLR